MMDKKPITHQIDCVKFDMYDSETVRKISVRPITESVAFDNLNQPSKGGLHDPLMGVSAYDRISTCASCGLDTADCTGHFGHIDLSATVYNPFMMKNLARLLNAKCLNCHQLRFRKKEKIYIFFKFILIKLGLLQEASTVQSLMYSTMQDSTITTDLKILVFLQNFSNNLDVNQYDAEMNSVSGDNDSIENDSIDLEHTKQRGSSIDTTTIKSEEPNKKSKKDLKAEQSLKTLQMKKYFQEEKGCKIDELLKTINKKCKELNANYICDQNVHIQIAIKDILHEFWGMFKGSKCAHCNATSTKIKKSGNIKFFKAPLSEKEKHKMKKYGLNPEKDALGDNNEVDVTTFTKKAKKKNKNKKKSKKEEEKNESESDSDISIEEEEVKQSNEKNEKEKNDKLIFLHPLEVKEHIKRLWELDGDLLSVIFGNLFHDKMNKYGFNIQSNGIELFFMDTIIVPPNRFRPENKGADNKAYLHQQTVVLTKILNLSNTIRTLSLKMNEKESDIKAEFKSEQEEKIINESTKKNNKNKKPDEDKKPNFKELIAKWVELQDTVNSLFDSQKSLNKKDRDASGIRQLLEKKEGIFRMKMMGKRVNYAGRSVISPDPNIGSNEVGIPIHIASKLTFPETVTQFNIEQLKKLVINGAKKYPGANFIEKDNGSMMSLEFMSEEFRIKLAETLDKGIKTVYRHLHTGDILLVNRQPTLHKPSIMSHKAKVLPGEKTIRLHYSNCNSYNADFDGDEMNVHLLQNHTARQEAYTISNTDNQYIVPTSGKPIRGLIQDSIVSAVFLTMKECFFTREEYFQLVYSALDISLNSKAIRRIVTVPPAIIKPKILYTGKQVVTTIMKSLATSKITDNLKIEEEDEEGKKSYFIPGINFDHSTKLSSEAFGLANKMEGYVTIRDNELLTGVLDKNHIGNSEYGLIHSFYEVYGSEMAGELISTFGRLFINYLQFFHGFTCGVDDIILKDEFNFKRRRDIEKLLTSGMEGLADHFGVQMKLEFSSYSRRNVFTKKTADSIASFKLLPDEREEIEKLMELQNFKIENSFTHSYNEDTLNSLKELREKYYENILKDDTIDANIDTVYKNAINKNFSKCTDVWLNMGLVKNFPRNYFSCMVQTGAKGSKVNHTQITCMLGQQELEGRRVPRMASGRTLPSFEPFDPNPRAGGLITDRFSTGIRPQEFFFHCMAGREGLIDTAVKTSRSGYLQRCLIKHLEQLVVNYDYTVRDIDGNIIQFLYGEDCIDVINTKYLNNFKFIAKNIDSYYAKYKPERLIGVLDTKTIKQAKKQEYDEKDTLLSKYEPWKYVGSMSDKIYDEMNHFIKNDHEKIFEKSKKNFAQPLSRSVFQTAVYMKYLHSLIQPGEGVGILAAQSVGEPSTQMTLNTFHLAGHGGANMTLGIPRLREILMTSENNIKTPIMTLPVFSKDREYVNKLARNFEKYNLIDIVKDIVVKRTIKIYDDNSKYRKFFIELQLEDLNDIQEYFNYNSKYIVKILKSNFIPILAKYISKQIKQSFKKGTVDDIIVQRVKEGKGDDNEDKEETEDKYDTKKRKNDEEDKSDDEEDDDLDDEMKKRRKDRDETDEFYTDEAEPETVEMDTDEEKSEKAQDEDNEMEIIKEEGEEEAEEDGKKKKNEINEKSKDFVYEGILIEAMKFDKETSKFTFNLTFEYTNKNILLKNLLDQVLRNIKFKSVPGVKKCHVLDRKNKKNETELILQLEGINFNEVYKYHEDIDLNRIDTNDIGSYLRIYGIEACRHAIVKEINNVFDSYHIAVDKRHLGLIADYITNTGTYRSFNRKGISYASSPLLKMTFETTMEFMISACMSKEIDNTKSSSAKIVLGQVPECGTGMFDVVENNKKLR